MERRLTLFFALAFLCAATAGARAQEAEETVRVRTRVVFLDALVRDKRTNNLVSDLKREDFEVLADGRAREITYFSREGDAGRRPLALVVVLDLNRIGAGRFLRRTEILAAMANVLARLPPADEVAILALDVGGTGQREWLTRLTRDRARVAAALSIIPLLVAQGSVGETPVEGEPPAPPPPVAPPPDEDNTAKKDGTGEIRTVNKDGSVTIKYVNRDGAMVTKTINKDGSESVDVDYGFELAAAVHEAALHALAERPNSQAAIIWVADGIAPIEYESRAQALASLIQANVIFSALVADMKTGFKLFKPVLKPLGNWAGISIYGSAEYLARQTGGEAVRVRRPDDYAGGLQKIVGNLTGRYSLGFTLAEAEQDDGQMHELEVRARARDARGKERKLEVVSRRGYFMPKETTAAIDEKRPSN